MEMEMTPDSELLRRFVKTNAEDAFAELVKRHVNLVYSAALRQVGNDAHLAQDVSQKVFSDLARKAASLARRESLTGWLYTSAHFAAAKIARTEHRRRDREERFMREPTQNSGTGIPPVESESENDWEQIRPALDNAMHELKESDREAILLRYFENRPFAEVGAKLCLNENAARMRVERALEKLRVVFARHGITTATALASIISVNAVQLAPTNFAATLTTTSLSMAGTGTTFGLLKIITATHLKLGISALVVAGATTAFVVQQQAQSKLRTENESLCRQIAQLQADNENLSNRLAATADAKALSDAQMNELLKLRNEITQLRRPQTASAASSEMKANNAGSDPIEIHTKARFVSIPAEDLPLLGIGWTTDAQGNKLGVLTEQQFEAIRKAFRGANDVNLIAEPEVITGNERETDMCVTTAVPVHGTNANIGVDLGLLPHFLTNSSTFDLNLVAQMNQLTGDPAHPDLQTIQIANQATLSPGQTVVLAKAIPEGGWLPDATNVPAGPRSLLIFVTPQVVDSRGKPGNLLSPNH